MSQDAILRIEEWMKRSRAEGFEYCCETAEENGLNYEVLAKLLAERQRLRDALAEVLDTASLPRWTPAERLKAIGDYARAGLGAVREEV